jgi:hypothetical protein
MTESQPAEITRLLCDRRNGDLKALNHSIDGYQEHCPYCPPRMGEPIE